MSHDHHDSHSNEPKPVSFTAPLILGIVAVFVLLAFVSIGNPCHERDCAENCSKECKEACEKGEHGEGHESEAEEAHEGHEGHESEAAEVHGTTEAAGVKADSAKTEPAKAEAKEEAHH